MTLQRLHHETPGTCIYSESVHFRTSNGCVAKTTAYDAATVAATDDDDVGLVLSTQLDLLSPPSSSSCSLPSLLRPRRSRHLYLYTQKITGADLKFPACLKTCPEADVRIRVTLSAAHPANGRLPPEDAKNADISHGDKSHWTASPGLLDRRSRIGSVVSARQ